MSGKERRSFSAEQKVAVVKRHLVEGVAISALCDQERISPTQFYQWQKQLFENGAAAFARGVETGVGSRNGSRNGDAASFSGVGSGGRN
ncbi:MAG: transposase [Pirellulales bacterium]|nr:transposase [Pirellulales bacterium]